MREADAELVEDAVTVSVLATVGLAAEGPWLAAPTTVLVIVDCCAVPVGAGTVVRKVDVGLLTVLMMDKFDEFWADETLEVLLVPLTGETTTAVVEVVMELLVPLVLAEPLVTDVDDADADAEEEEDDDDDEVADADDDDNDDDDDDDDDEEDVPLAKQMIDPTCTSFVLSNDGVW